MVMRASSVTGRKPGRAAAVRAFWKVVAGGSEDLGGFVRAHERLRPYTSALAPSRSVMFSRAKFSHT